MKSWILLPFGPPHASVWSANSQTTTDKNGIISFNGSNDTPASELCRPKMKIADSERHGGTRKRLRRIRSRAFAVARRWRSRWVVR